MQIFLHNRQQLLYDIISDIILAAEFDFKMKKRQKVYLDTVVLGRNGKAVVRTPLTVDSNTTNCATPSQSNNVEPVESPSDIMDDILNRHEDNDLNHSDNEESSNHQRNIRNFCNWEKIRPSLLKASFEDACFPDGVVVCGGCQTEAPSIRCRYSGPGQFFCEKCAPHIPEKRNQFHVMKKWVVITQF